MKSAKAPDPQDVAQAQSAANVQTAIAQSLLNQTNQVGPYGSLTYSQSGTTTVKDPTTGKNITIPRYTATTTLSPAQKALLGQEEEFDKLYNQIALAQTGRIGSHLSEPFDYNQGDYESWAGGLYDTLNNESNQRVSDQWDTKLKGQGLAPGSEAYNDAMKNIIGAQAKDRTAFMLDAYGTGLNTALTMRNQPINEIGALISGGQVQQPQFVNTPTTSIASPDIAGYTQNAYNQQMAQRNSLLGAAGGAAGSALGGWASGGFKTSDRRAKENIKHVGWLKDGTPISSYNYRGMNGGLTELGVMAQDIVDTHPDAVAETPSGMLAVNYETLASEVF